MAIGNDTGRCSDHLETSTATLHLDRSAMAAYLGFEYHMRTSYGGISGSLRCVPMHFASLEYAPAAVSWAAFTAVASSAVPEHGNKLSGKAALFRALFLPS